MDFGVKWKTFGELFRRKTTLRVTNPTRIFFTVDEIVVTIRLYLQNLSRFFFFFDNVGNLSKEEPFRLVSRQ
jgi:hypothetical protein